MRWLLGGIAGLVGAGWVALALLGDSFRRSFGASGTGALVIALPPVAALLLLLPLLLPGHRGLLHLGAAVATVVVLWGAWILRETIVVGLAAIGYAAAWLLYHRLALRGG